MKKPRMQIYVKATPEENQVIYTGIEFAEFIKYLPDPIENLMVLMGGSNVLSFETESERGLELFERRELVDKLATMNVHNLGNFCFTDYAIPGNTRYLSEEQIAELLYLGHMFKPLKLPFFEPLQNRFAYLAHDDGWYCKLYCREISDFMPVLFGKIAANAGMPISACSENICKQLLHLATAGILIDLEETAYEKGIANVKIYTVGEYSDMDNVLNNFEQIKVGASQINHLQYSDKECIIK